MDDWTYQHPDDGPPDTQRALPDEDLRRIEARRARAQRAEDARCAEFERTQALDTVGSPAEADVPLPFATPPCAAVTF